MTWWNTGTAWPTPSTRPGGRPPAEIGTEWGGARERLALVGPSAEGWAYRSAGGDFCRLLPAWRVPLPRRHALRQWAARPAPPGAAAVTAAELLPADERYFLVRYRVPHGAASLEQHLTAAGPRQRLGPALAALRALPRWWDWWPSAEHAGGPGPLLPLPADVVVAPSGEALLLALPFWQLVGPDEVFAEPARGWYLAPEVVRGTARVRPGRGWQEWRAADAYCLGAALTRCFFQLPPVQDAGRFLQRLAGGQALAPASLWSIVPYWMARAEGPRQAREMIALLASPAPERRLAQPPGALAERLEDCRRRMLPMVAARELCDGGKAADAFALLQDYLLVEEDYDVLVLAARTADQHLRRPLQALELLERAVSRRPDASQAYEEQLRILVQAKKLPEVCELIQGQPATAARLDERALRDFERLPPPAALELELGLAEYLLWRERHQQAREFIYGRIVEAGEPLWWKAEMNLAYGRALAGLQLWDDAAAQFAFVRASLERGHREGDFTQDEVRHHGEELVLYERWLQAVRDRLGQGEKR